jgi:hypothetical protein
MNYEPAFPMASMDITKGMSLLDYFAGQVLTGLIARDAGPCEQIAAYSYKQAQAMLAERERIMKDSA